MLSIYRLLNGLYDTKDCFMMMYLIALSWYILLPIMLSDVIIIAITLTAIIFDINPSSDEECG